MGFLPSFFRVHCVLFLLLVSPLCAQEPELLVLPGNGGSVLLLGTEESGLAVRETKNAILDARVLKAPGRPAVGVVWKEMDAGGRMRSFFAVSEDGRRFSRAKEADYDLLLRYRRFDPLMGRPDVPPELDDSATTGLWIVQYWTQGLTAWREALEDLGAVIHLHLANHANIVAADPVTLVSIKELPFVRAVTPYLAAYKLDETLLAEIVGGGPGALRPHRVNILTTLRGERGQRPVAERIRELGGRVEAVSPETYLMSATLSLSAVAALAAMDDVQWIDPWGPPEEDMNIARAFHGADYVQSVGGYDGAGARVEVLDGGADLTHGDLANNIVHGSNTPSSHGTATSGIVAGSGAGNASATGAAPSALLIVADYSGMVGSRYNHTSELQNPSLIYKAVLQSNSWGSPRTTSYTSVSQDMDLILFDFPRITICQSQSNAGNQDSRPQAWAKNIIAVGGIRHYNTATTSDDAWNGGASIGPAADGRIKPDLASFYDSIWCTDRPGGAGYSSGDYTTSFGGTSGATPIVAGHIVLLYDMWADGVFGNATPGATVFDNRPQNTTMKALVINTATQWNFSGTSSDLTRTHQGWGHPDLQNAWDLRNSMYIVDETDVLTNLSSTVHTLNVSAGTPALKATLVYRDNPGTTSSTQHRINDLDLKVTSPSGTVYYGNNGLLAGLWSTPGGSPNTKDTVENVFIQNPQAGTWQVEVIASELNQDTHVETPQLDADYALVVTGVTAAPTVLAADFTASPTSGGAPLTVNFTDLSTGTVTGWLWNFGDGTTSTAQSPTHVYQQVGTYTVSLTVVGPSGSDTKTNVDYINVVVPPPVADFTGTPLSGPAPLQVSFTDTSTGTVSGWLWIFGDGSVSNVQNPVHTYSTPGTYTVSLFVSGPSGTDQEVKTDYITVAEPPPVADFSGTPTSGFSPLTVSFTDLTTGNVGLWLWIFGDGSTSNLQNPVHTYNNPGTYTVTLTVLGAGGSDSETKTNYITVSNPAPVADFSATPTTGIAPLTVTFTNLTTGPATSWLWDFGDGNTSTAQDPVHQYLSPGTYTVSLTATGPNGSDMETKVDYITATGPSFYASFDGTVTLPGAGVVDDEDIVIFDPVGGNWTLHFDGSDVGLAATDVNAFHVIDGLGIVMSFSSVIQIPGLVGGPNGDEVRPEDLVLFAPTSVGASTAGSFLFIFDGSDVGLSGTGSGIDAVSVVFGSVLVLSTDGTATLPPFGPLPGQDLVAFIPSLLGSTTTGVWFYAFEGSSVGLDTPDENVDALYLDALLRSDLSTSGPISAGAAVGGAQDVSRFTGTYGPGTTGGTLELFLDLSALGISGNLDALHVIEP